MEVMFWLGLSFLILYRVLTIIALLIMKFSDAARNARDIKWFDPLLVPLELYVFRTVYLSFKYAEADIKQNAEDRKRQKAAGTAAATYIKPVEVNKLQLYTLVGEAVTESLPQIMLQSVFIIRSYNDPNLRDTQIELLMLSVLASLFSISDKFVKFDEGMGVRDKFKSANFRSFSKGLCFNMQSFWYLARVIWRLCTITSNFAVYVLIWTVIGGAFLPIYAFVIFILYLFFSVYVQDRTEILGSDLEIIAASVIFMG